MPGQRQRKAGTTKGHRKTRRLEVVPLPEALEGDVVDDAEVVHVPKPPLALDGKTDLRRDVLELWDAYWRSPLALAVDMNSDRDALEYLFQAINERRIVSEVAASNRLVRGSTGQPKLNPLYDLIDRLNREIRFGMQHFGMTALARFRLGIDAGEAAESLDKMKRALDQASGRVQEMPSDLWGDEDGDEGVG